MKKSISGITAFISLFLLTFTSVTAQHIAKPLRVGFAISITKITAENMAYAKSTGIDCIETSFGNLVNTKTVDFAIPDQQIKETLQKAKKAADDAEIEIWSIHMPFGEKIDLSLISETERQKMLSLHQKALEYCRILQPKIILFHPSFYLGLNEREVRMSQMIRSARELNKSVRAINATMVIENMLGFELMLADGKRERPLGRTVEENIEIMRRLPHNIYAAVDMNHIKDPEKLIRALGKRIKSVHVADGNGKQENHYFPCSGQGSNNWTDILTALYEAHYSGPFMFESAYKDIKDIKECYNSLYNSYVSAHEKSNKKK